MEDTLRDRAVRVELGIPLRVAGELAGVDRRTIAMYENAGPQFVSEETRDRCRELYAQFRRLLREAPGKRRGG